MIEYVLCASSLAIASGLYGSYKFQRGKDKKKLIYLINHLQLSPPVKTKEGKVSVLSLVNRIYGVGSLRKLCLTNRGRKVILSVVQDEYGWVAYKIGRLAIDQVLPRSRDTPFGFIRSIFRPDI